MRKFSGIILPLLFVAGQALYAAEPGPKAQNTVFSLKKKADSLFKIYNNPILQNNFEEVNAWLLGQTAKWNNDLADAKGLSGEDRHFIEVYGRVKILFCKYEFITENPWGQVHAEALSDWALEGQNLEEPALAKLNYEMAYSYTRFYLEARIGKVPSLTKYTSSFLAGSLNECKYLLNSNCPDSVKYIFLSFSLPNELKRNHVSPEVKVLEPFIRKGFKDPALVHYYDSLLTWYHQLDKGNPSPEWTMRNYDGKMIKLSDFRGKKLVIDNWATWCHVCVTNLPTYDSIAKANKDPNTVFLNLSIDEMDSADASIGWRMYIAEHHMDPSTSLNGPSKELDAYRKAFNIWEVPHYYIIDKDGKIVSLNCISPLDPEFLNYLKQ